MANQASSDASPEYHTVFIDTSLDTHLITVVSSSETFSDLKRKVLHEHALCFPQIGEIKIHGFKVKRRGKFYYLPESMLVKSVFHGVNKSWCVCLEASRLEVFDGNRNFVDPLSNNLLTSVGTMNIASDNETLAKSPRNHALLTNGDDERLQKQIDSRDQNLVLDVVGGDGSKSMEMVVKLMEDNCREAKRVDGDGEPSGYIQEKGDHYEKENGMNSTLKEGPESIIEGGIFDKPGGMRLEERAAETAPVFREDIRKPKRKKKRIEFASKELNAEVPESGMHTSEKETEEPVNSLANANVVAYDDANAIDEHRTSSAPGAKEDRSTIEERVTVQSERTGEIEKVLELNNTDSRENNPQMEPSAKRKRKRKQENEGDQDLLKDDRTLVSKSDEENNPQMEPSAKRKRKRKQENEGDQDLLKDDRTLVSKSDEVILEHSTVSQKSLVDKQHGGNASLDGLSNGNLEAVHLDSASPSKKREKKKRRSAKASNQEATVDPSAIPNEGVEHFGMHDNSNLGEKTAAVLASGQVVQDATSSEPGVPNETDQMNKQGDTAQETNLRPNSLGKSSETVSKNKEVGNLVDEHEASVAAMESKVKRKKVSKDRPAIVAEDNSCAEFQASDEKDKANDIPRYGNDSRDNHQNHFSDQNDGVEEHQNHASGQNGRLNVERDFTLEIALQMASSEKNKVSPLDDLQLKATETAVGSEPLGAGVKVDPPKSSKKRKKSKKANDLADVTPSASVTEHVEAFISNTSPSEPNKEQSDRLDTMSTSFLATDKEINDVIQNVVDSVQQMGNDQMGSERILAKSKKRSKKKQNSDAKLLPESTKQNENVVPNNTEQTEYPSEVTKQAAVATTDSKKLSVGSLMELENNNTTEKEQGVQSAHLMPQKLESKSTKRSHEAVVSRANELTGDVGVSCEGSGVNFNDYFTPKKHNPETAGSGEMHVDQTTVKAKKKTKNKKRDRHSETPSSEINIPPALDNSHGVIAKPLTGGSSSAEVQVSVTKTNTEKSTFQLNKKTSNPSDKGAEPPVSSKPNKVNSVPGETRRSNDAKLAGVVTDSKSKRAESNLKSSKDSSFLGATVNGRQSLEHQNHKDGGKATPVESLVGLSGSIFKDDSDESSSNEANDSGSSTRTPSDASLSSDYSDGESNAVSPSRKREEGGRTATSKPLSSEMSLHKILRSSSRYKKAKITASQSQLEDTESEPIDSVPETQS